jgi:RNA polymerase sigma-70 factor, ECF subfamily
MAKFGDDRRTGPEGVQGAIEAAWERARAAWPAIHLPREVFVEHLSALAGSESRIAGDLYFADLYLACACGRGIPAAISVLEREHLQRLPRFISKMSTDPVFTDEVLQAVRSKLLVSDGGPPKVLEYAGLGSLGAWLRVTAIRTAQTMLRRNEPEVRGVEPDAMTGVLGASADGELQMLRAKLGPRVTEAFRDVLRGLSAEQRNLLRLHYFDGLSFARMARLFRVNRATACRWVAEARRTIIDETRKKLREDLGLRESEVDAVTRLLSSQLDVSMSILLTAP